MKLKTKNFLSQNALILFGFLIVPILLEIASQTYIRLRHGLPIAVYNHMGYTRSPLVGFEIIPNLKDFVSKRVKTTFSSNSRGFRGTEEFGKKVPGELRVAILGDSSAFGFGAAHDHVTIAGFLKRELEKRFSGRKISVINAGCPAYTSYQVLAKFLTRVMDLEPDYVAHYYGWNDGFLVPLPFERAYFYQKSVVFDLADNWGAYIREYNTQESPIKQISHLPILSSMASMMLLSKPLQIAQRTPTSQTVAGPLSQGFVEGDPVYNEEMLKQIYENESVLLSAIKVVGAVPIAITLSSSKAYGEKARMEINTRYRKAAKENGAKLIDFEKAVQESGRELQVHDPVDFYHLTEEGNSFLAKLISQQIP